MQAYIAEIVHMPKMDWPKNISTLISFAGCDFNCPYCFSSEFKDFKEEFLLDIKLVKSEIKQFAREGSVVVFSGGEPTMQRSAMITLAGFVKEIGSKVCLFTTGSKPEVILPLLSQNLLDYVILDMKAPFEEETFEKITKSSTFFKQCKSIMDDVKHSISLLNSHKSEVEIEINVTVVPGLLFRKEDIVSMAKEVKDLNATFVLKPFAKKEGASYIDPRFGDIDPPSEEFLENLKKAVHKEVSGVRIEIRI